MSKLLFVVVALTVFATACSSSSTTDAVRDESGEIVASDEVGVFRLQTGDCVVLPAEEADEVESLEGVPCSDPHDGEVLGMHLMTDVTFPGDDAVIAEAEVECLAMFDAVTGLDFVTDPDWNLNSLFPTEDSWDRLDDREIVCLAIPLDAQLTTNLIPRV